MQSQGTLQNSSDLILAVQDVYKKFGSQVWWRGQRNAAWDLSPSVYRNEDFRRSEESLTARFKWKAPSRHQRVPALDDDAGWLFLMQHYRLPTRLLDWSESPLVGAYFATECDPACKDHSQIQDTDGALFALSPYALNEFHLGKRVLLLPSDDPVLALMKRPFDRNIQDMDDILAVRPAEVDLRLMVQQSVFTIHGKTNPLETIDSHSSFILKFEIPAKRKKGMRRELKHLGIRPSSVFPDLENLAIDVSATKFHAPVAQDSPYLFMPEIDDFSGEASS